MIVVQQLTRYQPLFYGAHVKTGKYSEHITHYNVLHTLEVMYGFANCNYTECCGDRGCLEISDFTKFIKQRKPLSCGFLYFRIVNPRTCYSSRLLQDSKPCLLLVLWGLPKQVPHDGKQSVSPMTALG